MNEDLIRQAAVKKQARDQQLAQQARDAKIRETMLRREAEAKQKEDNFKKKRAIIIGSIILLLGLLCGAGYGIYRSYWNVDESLLHNTQQNNSVITPRPRSDSSQSTGEIQRFDHGQSGDTGQSSESSSSNQTTNNAGSTSGSAAESTQPASSQHSSSTNGSNTSQTQPSSTPTPSQVSTPAAPGPSTGSSNSSHSGNSSPNTPNNNSSNSSSGSMSGGSGSTNSNSIQEWDPDDEIEVIQ